MTQLCSNELRRKAVVEKMWLHHYNNTLLDQGLITEIQHRKMAVKINCRQSYLQR